ncbi:hypothetical protein PCANC_13240 [Puccinia coronata f. sp. avenae]|uniref:ATP-dependent DNA helicase sgs1 n=1 Tax=Puccinia coronata f. sp. avenae TaxID=200324 RepID=A0A2N5V0P7_9BASI|nr:hypothetical protein PCANC_13240 [Puccinia coronata f. sp. avenae]PLW48469.1 hypothetical protein PCASD_04254 [Puccinia coronata f. sp. avenae]
MSNSEAVSDAAEESRPIRAEDSPAMAPANADDSDAESDDSDTKSDEDDNDPTTAGANANKMSLTLPPWITNLSDHDLMDLIKKQSRERYGDNAKEIQICSVMNLVKWCNSFFLAGTGYGKKRIVKMFWDLYPKYKKGMVLCLNPLDSLRNNQVEEKEKAKMPVRAVNLTKMNLTAKVIKDLSAGVYSFIYLSPEVLLNNALFHELFYDRNFL